MDYWNVTVQTDSGPPFHSAKRNKECFLTKKDANTTLVFKVTEAKFSLNMLSSGCTDDMEFQGYNTNTRVAVKNTFHKPVTITLTHQYSDDRVFSQTWRNVAPGATTL